MKTVGSRCLLLSFKMAADFHLMWLFFDDGILKGQTSVSRWERRVEMLHMFQKHGTSNARRLLQRSKCAQSAGHDLGPSMSAGSSKPEGRAAKGSRSYLLSSGLILYLTYLPCTQGKSDHPALLATYCKCCVTRVQSTGEPNLLVHQEWNVGCLVVQE